MPRGCCDFLSLKSGACANASQPTGTTSLRFSPPNTVFLPYRDNSTRFYVLLIANLSVSQVVNFLFD